MEFGDVVVAATTVAAAVVAVADDQYNFTIALASILAVGPIERCSRESSAVVRRGGGGWAGENSADAGGVGVEECERCNSGEDESQGESLLAHMPAAAVRGE